VVVASKLVALPLILLVALGMIVPASVMAQDVGEGKSSTEHVWSNATPVVANGSYARILNHTIVLAERLLNMWGIPADTEPWALINETKNLLSNITAAEEAGNKTLARELFIEGMKKVHKAISLAAKEYMPLPVKERLRIRVRVSTYLRLVNALNATARALEAAVERAESKEVINATLADELRSVLANVSKKLAELRKYIDEAINGTAEWDGEYFNSTIEEVRELLRYVSKELNEAIATTIVEKVEVRVEALVNSTKKSIEELRENAQKLRDLGFVNIANKLESIADKLSKDLEKLESMIEEKLNVSKMRLIVHLGNLERMMFAARIQAALRHRITYRALEVGYNVSKVIKAVQTLIEYIESKVVPNPEIPDHIKEEIEEIADLSREVIDVLKQLAESAASGDEEGVSDSIQEIKDLMDELKKRVADLRKEAGHGKPYLKIITAVISRVEHVLNSVTKYVIGHAERVLHRAKEAEGEKHSIAYTLTDRALKLVETTLKISKLHICGLSSEARDLLESAEEALDQAKDMIEEGNISDAVEALNLSLSYLSSVEDMVKCNFIKNHIEVAVQHINEVLSILQK